MDEYSSLVAECLVGIVHVDISSLVFQDEVEARQIDDAKVQKLINVFTTSSNGCERDELDNHIPALISPRELDYILQISRLTRDDLQKSLLGGGYPKLNTLNNKIYCLHGRHRLRAAAAFLRNSELDNYWWTVELYAFEPENHHRGTFLRKKSEQFSHQAKFSDGEVYRKIRYYQRQSREDLVQDWMIRLTEGKQDDIYRLLKNKDLVEAFDTLLPFPGLWCGLELGNIRNHLALHCDEELICYLRHIHSTWNELTLGNSVIQQAVDIQTVRSLQSRAPSVSVTDRHYIIREMDNRTLFSTIVDGNLRELIKQALLRLQVIIPTIKSFHENVKYFGIGAEILKTHLLNGLVETTIYRTMCSQWSPPENVLVEFREGEFQHALHPEEELLRFAYKQVFISALRQFPSLSKYGPRQEWRQEAIRGTIDPVYSLLFLARAQLLGFRTEKILRGLENAPEIVAAPHVEPILGLNSDGEIIKQRWGRPFSNAYKKFRTQLFLPNLLQAQAEVSFNPSVMFVQQDFLNAFFGSTSEIIVSAPLTQVIWPPEAIPPPGPVSSAQIPRETVVTPEPVAPSLAEVPLAPETQYYGAPREPSVSTEQSSEMFVSPESSRQVASKTSISPFSQTAMEFERIETTSEVSEGTAQNGRSVSEAGSPVSELDNDFLDNTESQVISRAPPEIGTLETGVSQGYRSSLMSDSLNSPISAAGTEEGHLPESQSPPAAIPSQRPQSFLSPGCLDTPISQGYRSSEAWNSQDRRSFLTPRPPSYPPSAARAEDDQPPDTQSLPTKVRQGHQPFLALEAGPTSTAMFQSHRSFLALKPGPASAAMSQSHRSFLIPESGSSPSTGILLGHRLSESPMIQAQNAEMTEWHRSFIDVSSTTSEVSENIAQNDQSISEISPIVDELDERYINNRTDLPDDTDSHDLPDDTDSHVISRASPEIDTLEAEVSQGRRSFLMPESLNSPISVAGSSESQSPTAAIGSQRLRSFLLPGLLASPGYSQVRRSFLTPGPLSSLPLAAGAKGLQSSETQRHTSWVSHSHRSFLMPESRSPPAQFSQSHRSPLALEPGPESAAISQSRRSFLTPDPPATRALHGRLLSESPIPQAVRDRQSFLTPESQLADQTSSMTIPSQSFEFIEYNGMLKLLKSTQDMDQYLQQWKGWIGMVIRKRIAKTMRFDHIVKHMANNGPSQDEAYALVKAPYAEQFRRNLVKVTRSAENNEDGLGFASSNKRPKN